MILNVAIPWCLLPVALASAGSADLLRFTNGDQLHGSFLGINEGPQTVWQRDDLAAPVEFKPTQLRHVVLHNGRPLKPLGSLSHLGLVNGDRMPGTITGMDADSITLDTSYAGVLRIPRKQVAMLAPNPMGGRVYYHGPFVEDEWKMTTASCPGGLPPATATREAIPDKADKDLPGRWGFSGSAWYWNSKRAGTALVRETGMPDRAVLRFDLAWKNRLCLAIGFHADFARPKARENEPNKDERGRGFGLGDASDLPRVFGNSYVLQLYANYLMLYRSSVNGDGKTMIEQIHLNNNANNQRLAETGSAQVELRSNRLSGCISLFINDDLIAQWNEQVLAARDGASFAGKGAGFGFVVQADDSPVRISDVVVSEWNGMPDSARSLQVDDQDIVLMANGTDRYAGRVGSLDPHGNVLFQGKHGNFQFPLDEVAEVRFARDHLATAPDDPPDNLIVRFSPIGSVSGRPLPSANAKLNILSPIAGELKLTLDSAVMLDFNSSKQIIDDWDASF